MPELSHIGLQKVLRSTNSDFGEKEIFVPKPTKLSRSCRFGVAVRLHEQVDAYLLDIGPYDLVTNSGAASTLTLHPIPRSTM